MNQAGLSRTIGLPGAVFLIVGYVIGASIFILPGSLAADAGPSVYLAYLLAAIPAALAGFATALAGSAIPASGSLYLLIRDVLSPAFGFLYLWLAIAMAAVVIPLVALGFADYLAYFHVGYGRAAIALSVIALCVVLNYCGMRAAIWLQNAMVVAFIAGLLIFGIGGVASGDASLLAPMLPRGISPLVGATITAYFSYTGVFIIAEVAGEIRNPGRTIPLAILLSFAVIVLLYALVPLALASTLPWETLDSTPIAVVSAAQQFLPEWLVFVVAACALFAAATSVNGITMGLSRDLYKGAKTGLFPASLAGIHPRFQTPGRAVLVIGLLSAAGVSAGGSVVQYAQVAVMALMVIQIMTGVALLRLPRRLPKVHEASPFKLRRYPHRIVCSLYVAFSAVFLLTLGAEQPAAVVSGIAFVALGILYYGFRMGQVVGWSGPRE